MRIGCDVGGTFTDLVAVDPATGEVRTGKALNSGRGPRDGVLDALTAAGVDPADVTSFAHGTTTVTNLLIERTGAEIGLVTTRGFRDVLEIQLSFRARTFDATYVKTPPLVPRHRRLEVGGRIAHDGTETEPLDLAEVEDVLVRLRDDGVECLAVALYNAYADPRHEQRVAEVWRRIAPGRPVTCATDVDPRIGEFERTSTAVLNASAVPRMREYDADLDGALPTPVHYLHSAGGVVPADEARERPIQLAFSGPAAGVLAGRRVAADLGVDRVITFDMGGTSCDVCLVDGDDVRERQSFDVAWGMPARIRCLEINTVGAGGGSIATRDVGGALRVGPRSAGALPGPCCYGRGGTEPTVTDANLALGILDDGLLGGGLALDRDAALAALTRLGTEFGTGPLELAAAIHRQVNATMAQAVREITVRHGIDPRGCALVGFGGAGPQHATGVAAELGMSTVVVPLHGSVLSALGLVGADLKATATQTVLADVAVLTADGAEGRFAALEAEATARLGDAAGDEVVLERWAGLRYRNQWHEIALRADATDGLADRFEDAHEQRFGTRLGDPVEVVDVWVTATHPVGTPALAGGTGDAGPLAAAPRRRHLELAGAPVAVHDPRRLTGPVTGPCLVQEDSTVTYVPAGATCVRREGHLVIEGVQP